MLELTDCFSFRRRRSGKMLIQIVKYKRIIHLNEPGHAHELTFSCLHGANHFCSDDACCIFAQATNKASLLCRFRVIAYVIMPDHVHLLIFPENEDYQISRILSAIKLPVSLRISGLNREKSGKPLGRFWQRGGGYDRNIVSRDAIIASIDYVHNNPVRKGLCKCPQAWKWSSAGFYAGLGQGPVKIDNDVLVGLH